MKFKSIQEIETRKAAILEEMKAEGADLDALKEEARKLTDERGQLNLQLDELRRQAEEAGITGHFHFLGMQDNPYPYIKACDLYVQPSRYEGNCVAVHEAQMLGKPVVITRYATSASQLEDGVDGVIVPMDNEGCANGIAALLRNTVKSDQLMKNCHIQNFSNACETQKLMNLLQ